MSRVCLQLRRKIVLFNTERKGILIPKIYAGRPVQVVSFILGVFFLFFFPSAGIAGHGDLKWEFTAEGGISAGCAMGTYGDIYFGSRDKKLYSLGPDGVLKWVFETNDHVETHPFVGADETIYVTSTDGILYALSSDGSLMWKYASETKLTSPVQAKTGILYAGGRDGKLYAVKPGGGLKWRFSTGDIISAAPVVGADGTVYAVSRDNRLYAVDTQGKIRWSFQTGDWIEFSPALDLDGTIYCGSFDGNLYAVLPDGNEKWRYNAGQGISSSPVIGQDGTIYIGTWDNTLHAVLPDGTQKWVYKAGGKIFGSTPVVDSSGNIYFGSLDNLVYALDKEGGLLWTYDAGDDITGSPVLREDGLLLSATAAGKLLALETEGVGLAISPWPAFQRDNNRSGRYVPPLTDTPGSEHFRILADEAQIETLDIDIHMGTAPQEMQTDIYAFEAPQDIYALSISGSYALRLRDAAAAYVEDDPGAFVRVVLIDENLDEYQVFEKNFVSLSTEEYQSPYPLALNGFCEESCVLPEVVNTFALKITVRHGSISLSEIGFVKIPLTGDADILRKKQNLIRIQNINEKNPGWLAGETSVSNLPYQEKKQLVGVSDFREEASLYGFEYYRGGIFTLDEPPPDEPLPAPGAPGAGIVSGFDWRNRHGKNWVTPVRNQNPCGSCGVFAPTGAIEALVNIYFNDPDIDLDISEQYIISCGDIGRSSCDETWTGADGTTYRGRGWMPGQVLDYYQADGVVDETCFTYFGKDKPCDMACANPVERIWTSGKISFGTTYFPKTEASVKRMLVKNGPITSGIDSLRHSMTLVGFETDPNDGRTVWVFKNSWGSGWGAQAGYIDYGTQWGSDWNEAYAKNGFAYVKVDVENLGWTHAVKFPIKSANSQHRVQCVDEDGDEYCTWGLGDEKPDTCPDFCKEEQDCDDSDPGLGPFDENFNCQGSAGPAPPVAAFTMTPSRGPAPLRVVLDASDSYANQGLIQRYEWAVDEMNAGAGKVLTYTFEQAGQPVVSLTVVDSDGRKAVTKRIVSVTGNRPPVADFTLTPTVGRKPLTVSVNAGESYDLDDAIMEYEWNFGDGKTLSGEVSASHTYEAEGEYPVTLRIKDTKGQTGSRTRTVQVTEDNLPPEVRLSISPSRGKAPLSVYMNARDSEDTDGAITEFLWDFGDGASQTSAYGFIQHTYTQSGQYSLILTVKDDQGLTADATEIVNVLSESVSSKPPTAVFTLSPDKGTAPLTVQMDARNSYDTDGSIAEYIFTISGEEAITTTIGIAEHSFDEPGTYTVSLLVKDNDGLTGTHNRTIMVSEKTDDPVEGDGGDGGGGCFINTMQSGE